MEAIPALLATLRFAAEKHRNCRRKDPEASPYINHPIDVAELLARVGGINEVELIQAAILHDTIEDTETSGKELEAEFGSVVRKLVEEVTDDKRLAKDERKRLQIEHSPHLSAGAKQIKLGDKISNVRDVTHNPPPDWSNTRRAEYIAWSRAVVDGCRGTNPHLESEFDAVAAEAEALLSQKAR